MKSYSQALKILKRGKILIGDEYIKSSKSLNRVCAENIYSKELYPSGDNSSFDGFAINSEHTKNLSKKKSKLFKILGTIAAGNKPSSNKIKRFQTFEIMTGGLLPKGLNTIIPIEKIVFYPSKKKTKFIIIDKKITKNNNVRFAGSDYKKGDKIISAGEIINSSHILAFKSLGIEKITVKKLKLNSTVISLGGGAFINERIRKEILKKHISFWLNWSIDTLINRIKNSKKRPLAVNSTKNELIEIIKKRSVIYSKALYKIDCENFTKQQIAKKIIDIYETN